MANPKIPCCMGSAVFGPHRCTCEKMPRITRECRNRAEMIVRGLTDPNSGWYDSPDDLTRVIAEELAALYEMGRKSV